MYHLKGKKIQGKCQKYWKSQGISEVEKSGNAVITQKEALEDSALQEVESLHWTGIGKYVIRLNSSLQKFTDYVEAVQQCHF